MAMQTSSDQCMNAVMGDAAGDVTISLVDSQLSPEMWQRTMAWTNAFGYAAFCDRMVAGEAVNASEGRAALHFLCRDTRPAGALSAMTNASEQWEVIRSHRDDALARAEVIRSDSVITDVIHLGAGGSHQGAQLVNEVFQSAQSPVRLHCIDCAELTPLNRLLQLLDPAATAVVVVSKSGTTIEAQTQFSRVHAWMHAAGVLGDGHPRLTGVSVNVQALEALGIPKDGCIGMDPTIGGRFSVWSSAGIGAAIVLGSGRFWELLRGGAEADVQCLDSSSALNPALALAGCDLLNGWARGLPERIVLSWDRGASELMPYVRQLELESLGKPSAVYDSFMQQSDGSEARAPAVRRGCPAIWGGYGPRAQHSFMQMLHGSGARYYLELISVHQADAPDLATMQCDVQASEFEREGHPHVRVTFNALTPRTLGWWLSVQEWRVIAKACAMGINPFDQPAVERAKQMVNQRLQPTV